MMGRYGNKDLILEAESGGDTVEIAVGEFFVVVFSDEEGAERASGGERSELFCEGEHF